MPCEGEPTGVDSSSASPRRTTFHIEQYDSLQDMIRVVTDEIMADQASESPLVQYRALADAISDRIPAEINAQALSLAKNGDASAFVVLNLKSIFSALEVYKDDPDIEDLFQSALLVVVARSMGGSISSSKLPEFVHTTVRNMARSYIAHRDGIPVEWIKSGSYFEMKEVVKDVKTLSDIEALAESYSKKLGLPYNEIRSYLLRLAWGYIADDNQGDAVWKDTEWWLIDALTYERSALNEAIKIILSDKMFTDRERFVVSLFLELEDIPHEETGRLSLIDIGNVLRNELDGTIGVSNTRVGQIMKGALKKIRDHLKKQLRELI